MPASNPIYLGGNGATVEGASAVITTIASAPAGSCIAVWVNTAGSTHPASVTDSAGNTYVRVRSVNTGGGASTALFIALNATLPTGGTITAPASNTPVAQAAAFTGVLTTNAVDISATNTGTTGTLVGPTVATTYADALILGCFGLNFANPTVNANADYPLIAPALSSGGSFPRGVIGVYRKVLSTGSYAPATSVTFASAGWTGITAVLKTSPQEPIGPVVRVSGIYVPASESPQVRLAGVYT